ncbi:MAG: acetyl-CoA decarbonylase/synthase complex subunit delta [Deltaproteobacteria bacterium]|nr:MAG: acetyl-CoA decarbonylase/synthase complex subunit delta [Deltaproteobacteria bacterium]
MAFKIPTQAYTGSIRPISLEKDGKTVTVGGETCFPFYLFEGEMPHFPKIAIEVPDVTPEDWAEACLEPYKDVAGDPVAWAKKAQDVYKADIIFLWLKSTDPNDLNRSAEEAAETAKKVLEAIDVPLIVWGTANVEKDAEVLRQVAMACAGTKVCLGPVEEGNHKQIGAQALAYNHMVIASTPIDINLAKQLNILLGNLGVSDENIIIDPTTGALGYGIEYSYSVIERIRQAALTQQDERLQFPIIANFADEVWKSKEAKTPDDPLMGNAENRGILLEAITATTYLLAGADILVMRHPKAIQLVRNYIADMAGVERPAQISIPVEEEEAASLEQVAEAGIPEVAAQEAPPPAAPTKPAQPVTLSAKNLPSGMKLQIDIAKIMDVPVTVGGDYVLTMVKVSESEEGGITITQDAMDTLSAFWAAKKQGLLPGTFVTLAEKKVKAEKELPVEEGRAVKAPAEVKEEMPVEEKLEEKKREEAKKKEEEKKEEERVKTEYAKTWEVPEDTVGEFKYPKEKKEDFSGKQVEVLGASYEGGKPEDKEDWRQKLKNKDEMVQYLKTALRYWYSTDWYGSEKRKTPA